MMGNMKLPSQSRKRWNNKKRLKGVKKAYMSYKILSSGSYVGITGIQEKERERGRYLKK